MATTPEVIEIGNVGGPVGPTGPKGDKGDVGPAGPPSSAATISNAPAGTISGTTVQAALNELDTEKLAKTTDTFTGQLTVTANTIAAVQLKALTGGTAHIEWQDELGARRWRLQRAWVGGDFALLRCDTAGVQQSVPFKVAASDGAITIDGVSLTVPTPTAAGHAVTKAYADLVMATSGNKMTAAISTDGAVSWDSFNRASSTTTMTVSDSGHTWTPLLGTWGITLNQAYKVGAVAEAIATLPGVGDGAFRVVDANNFLFVRITAAGAVELFKKEATVNTLLVSAQGALVHSLYNRLEISFTGADITIMVSGTLVAQYKLTAAELVTFPITATACGISSGTTATTARWENFYTSKVPKHVVDNTRVNEMKMNARDSIDKMVSWDSFNRPASVLGSGISDSGHTWTQTPAGAFNLNGTYVTKTGATDNCLASITGVGNGSIVCDVYDQNSFLAFRAIDNMNYLLGRVTSTGVVQICKYVNGVFTILASGSTGYPNNNMHRLEITFLTDTITASNAGSFSVTYTLDATEYALFPATITNCGIGTNTLATGRWDNFQTATQVRHHANLSRTGDTMTGDLTINKTASTLVLKPTTASATGIDWYDEAGFRRFRIYRDGAGLGNINFARYDAAGVLLAPSAFLFGMDGAVNMSGALSVRVPTPTISDAAATKAYVDSTYTATTTQMSNKVSSAISTDSAVVWDSFNRANSTTSMGVSDSGHTWTSVTGVWGISSNQAYKVGATAECLATVPGVGDGLVAADVNDAARLAFRVVDTLNYLFVRLNTGTIDLYKRVAGANVLLASATPAAFSAVSNRLEISFTGPVISVRFNAGLFIQYTLTAADYAIYPNTLTTCGLSTSTGTTPRWENFYISTLVNHGNDKPGALSNKVSTVIGTDSGVSWDSFNRPAGPIGVSDSGHTWTALTGTWLTTATGKAYCSTTLDNIAIMPGVGDGLVACDSLDVNSRLAFRVVDASNYLWVCVNASGLVQLTKKEAGVNVSLAQVFGAPISQTQYKRLEVSMNGSDFTVAVNGQVYLQHTLSTADATTFANTFTNVGMYAVGITARWDNFHTSTVSKAYAPGPVLVERKTASVIAIDSAVVWDTFNRGPSTTALQVSESGHLWTQVVGVWGTVGSQAYKPGTAADALATVVGVGDGLVGADVNDSSARIAFRIADASNFLWARVSVGGMAELWKRELGVNTMLATAFTVPVHSLLTRLEVSFTGSDISVFADGEFAVKYTLTTAEATTFPNTNPTCGMYSGSTGAVSRWDTFYVSKQPKHGSGTSAVALSNKMAAAVTGDIPAVWDSFNRPVNATAIGMADSGQTWNSVVGVWGITVNTGTSRAYKVSGPSESLATVTGVGDGVIAADLVSTMRIAFRIQDSSNYLFVYINALRVQLLKKVLDVNTIINDATVTPPTGTMGANPTGSCNRVEVSFMGDKITISVNGAIQIQHALDPADFVLFPSTLNTVGLSVGSGTGHAADTFYVSPVPKFQGGVRVGVGSPEGKIYAHIGTKYTDLAATAGAIEWVKASGAVSTATGWRVTYGDTGQRTLSSWDALGAYTAGTTPLLSPFAPRVGNAGSLKIRRVNDMVTLYGTYIALDTAVTAGLQTNILLADLTGFNLDGGYISHSSMPTGNNVVDLINGWGSPVTSIRVGVLGAQAAGTLLLSANTSGGILNLSSGMAATTVPWPLTLPGI